MKKIIFLTLFALFTFVVYGNNLQWSNKTPRGMNWNDAMNYCKNLNESGYNDWRLPTISELRTLIQNCSATATDGTCKVNDSCLSDSKCNNDHTCHGCIFDRSGKYSKLGDTETFWSSSFLSDISKNAWYVAFDKGTIYYFDNMDSYDIEESSNPKVRCVRGHLPNSSKAPNSKENNPKKTGNVQWSEKAPRKMNWNNAVNYCKNLNEDGYANWRLPTIDELRRLITNCPDTQTGGKCGVIDTCLFDWCWNSNICIGCGTDFNKSSKYSKLGDRDGFWSSSVLSKHSERAFIVHFSHGSIQDNYLSDENNVRCVSDYFQNSSDAIPSNKENNPKKTGNVQWSEKAPNTMNWIDAVEYCKNLNEDGHNDWRLPNIDELRTLIKAPETISGGKCPISEKAGKLSSKDWSNADCVGVSKLGDRSDFWSSSVLSDYSSHAWYVNFDIGDVLENHMGDNYYVRCVR